MGGDQVVRVEPHDQDSCPTDGSPDSPLPLPPHQDTLRRHLSADHGAGPHQTRVRQHLDPGLPSLLKHEK